METLEAKVLGPEGTEMSRVTLPAEVFGRVARIPLLHQVVVAEQAKRRSGTHSTKGRAQVAGGGAKPFRQKGTGSARQGSIRAPHFRGGGIAHGPTPHSHAKKLPKKMVTAALCEALSNRAESQAIYLIGQEVFAEVSTKFGDGFLRGAELGEALVLVVATSEDEVVSKSLRNLLNVRVTSPGSLLTGSVLASDAVVFTQLGFSQTVERLSDSQIERQEESV